MLKLRLLQVVDQGHRILSPFTDMSGNSHVPDGPFAWNVSSITTKCDANRVEAADEARVWSLSHQIRPPFHVAIARCSVDVGVLVGRYSVFGGHRSNDIIG